MSNAPNPPPADPTTAIQAGVNAGSGPAPTPQNNYAWIWFFVFIVVASVGVTGFMIWFNLSIQLKPDQLETAWELWKENGPKNYNMVYTKRINDDRKVFAYGVKVRNGQVVEVKQDKEFLEKTKEHNPLIYHSMDSLLRDAARFLEMDARPEAKKVYVTAIFDDKNGAMLRYVRRVMGGTERVELHIELKAVE